LPIITDKQIVRAEVEDRLRDMCGNWPTGEFDRIVADVTATAMKYNGHERRRGAAKAIALVESATHSIQEFLHLETQPLR